MSETTPRPRRRKRQPQGSPVAHRCTSCARVIPEDAPRCRFCGIDQPAPEGRQ